MKRIGREKALISQQGAAAIHFEEHDVIGLLIGDEVGGDGIVNNELIGWEWVVSGGMRGDEAERVKHTRAGKVAERANVARGDDGLWSHFGREFNANLRV